MRLKQILRLFVPPILWSARSYLKGTSRNASNKANPTDFIASGDFRIAFEKVTQDHGIFFVPTYASHRPACKAILAGGVYEPATHDLIDKIMQHKGGSLIHAGTFFGDMLPTFSKSCPATVYAFEPVLENFVLAQLCVEANGLDNVFLQNAGLSDRIGIGRIQTTDDTGEHRGGASAIGDQGQAVGLVTIDSLGLDDVTGIQLDVEGHELPALKGARVTIERNAPIILIEDNARTCNAFLEGLGYRHVGTIPGLFVWSRPADQALLRQIMPEKHQH